MDLNAVTLALSRLCVPFPKIFVELRFAVSFIRIDIIYGDLRCLLKARFSSTCLRKSFMILAHLFLDLGL